jgi:hypothetical protein
MNIWIRPALAGACLALLLSAPAWATKPKASDLPPGSGILVPPGCGNSGPHFFFKPPPIYPGQPPKCAPPGTLHRRGDPRYHRIPRPLVRPALRPHPRPLPPPRFIPRPPRPLPPPRFIARPPRPFSPVIPLPPPRGRLLPIQPRP